MDRTDLFPPLGDEQAILVLGRIVRLLHAEALRCPRPGEAEENYVAAEIVPRVRAAIAGLQGLTISGEGIRRAAPVHYLGLYMYPDVAVMHYDRRIVALEAKYIDFASARGDLTTAIGQSVIYAEAGYLAAGAILLGQHAANTRDDIERENQSLSERGLPWRLCSPHLRQS